MDYNLLKKSYCYSLTTTWSGAIGYTNQPLSYDSLLTIVDDNLTDTYITVTGGKYIGMYGQLGRNFYCKQFRLYASGSGDDPVLFYYKDSAPTEHTLTPTYSPDGYYYYDVPSDGEVGATAVSDFYFIFCANTTNKYVYECQVLNWDEAVDFGIDGTNDDEITLPASYSRATSLPIYNDNPIQATADARVVPSYTGDYLVDKILKLSDNPDQDITNSGGWYTVDTSVGFPSTWLWNTGTFSNTEQSGNYVRLSSSSISGTWTSPVIQVSDPSCIIAYIYGGNKTAKAKLNKYNNSINEILECRASNIEPEVDALFAVWAATETNEYTGVATKSKWLLCELDGSSNSFKAHGTDGQNVTGPLMCAGSSSYYMGMNSNMITRWDGAPVDWTVNGGRRIKEVSRLSTSYWELGYDLGYDMHSVYGPFWWPYTKMIPIPGTYNSWYRVLVLPYYDWGQHYSYYIELLNEYTRNTYIQINNYGSIDSFWLTNFGSCLASDINGVWVYYHGTVKKYSMALAEVGSFTILEQEHISIVDSANNVPGFWGISNNKICFYEHSISESTLTRTINITSNTPAFNSLGGGAVDKNNNLWLVDRTLSMLYRVNYELGVIDFSMNIPSVVSVVPYPSGDKVYVYCYDDPDYSGGDTIRLIDRVTGHNTFQCLVPGWDPDNSVRAKMIGVVTEPSNTGYMYPAVNDPIWGNNGALTWQDYPNANLGLPRGLYKQFRITLQRDATSTTSPYLEYVKIPIPLVLRSIPWKGYKNVYIDTDLTTGANPGNYNLDLLVWWPQE